MWRSRPGTVKKCLAVECCTKRNGRRLSGAIERTEGFRRLKFCRGHVQASANLLRVCALLGDVRAGAHRGEVSRGWSNGVGWRVAMLLVCRRASVFLIRPPGNVGLLPNRGRAPRLRLEPVNIYRQVFHPLLSKCEQTPRRQTDASRSNAGPDRSCICLVPSLRPVGKIDCVRVLLRVRCGHAGSGHRH